MSKEEAERPRRKRKQYGVRLRRDESEEWGPWDWYRSKTERDNDARLARVVAGFRVHTAERFTDNPAAVLMKDEG